MELNETQIAQLVAIDAGEKSGQYVYATAKTMKAFTDAGLIEGNPNAANAAKEIPFRLTATGKEKLPVSTETQTPTPPATGTVSTPPAAPTLFVIATVAPPAIVRTAPTGGGRAPKYPQLDQLEIGQAVFIPAEAGSDAKKLSKGFGSMVADRNQKNKDKYFTSRGLPDGKVAGFGEQFAGISGTGIYRRPLEEKPVRKPRTKKADATKTPEQLAAEAAAAAAVGGNAANAGQPEQSGVAPTA